MPDLYIYTKANSARSALIRDETDVLTLGRVPEWTLGDKVPVRLFFVEDDDTFASFSGNVAYTPALAICPESPVPTDGTWQAGPSTAATSGALVIGQWYQITTFVSGDNFTNVGGTNATGAIFAATGTTPTTWTNASSLINISAPLDADATPAEVETALNAVTAIVAQGGVDVVARVGWGFVVTWRGPGSRAALSVISRDLLPPSDATVSEAVAGDGSTQEVQTIRLQVKIAAFLDTWTPITDGWSGTLELSTDQMLLLFGGQQSVTGLMEIKVAGPSASETTYLQMPVRCDRDRIHGGVLSPPSTGTAASTAELAAAVAAMFQEDAVTIVDEDTYTITVPAGCRHFTVYLTVQSTDSADGLLVTLSDVDPTPTAIPDGTLVTVIMQTEGLAPGEAIELDYGVGILEHVSDGSDEPARADLVMSGSEWLLLSSIYPAQ